MEHKFLLIPIRDLLVHEETRPSHVVGVAASIAEQGRVRKPIIVEEKTLTIIDGHHRLQALRLLGARYAPVVLTRYGDGIRGVKPPKRVIMVRASNREEALGKVAEKIEAMTRRGPGRLVLRTGREEIVLMRDLESLHRAIGVLDGAVLGKRGRLYRVHALPDPISPRLVLSAALRGEPFPSKTSIHVTPLKRLEKPIRLSELV